MFSTLFYVVAATWLMILKLAGVISVSWWAIVLLALAPLLFRIALLIAAVFGIAAIASRSARRRF